ncbi:MAG: glycosyltransferase [Bacteroidota bacterium]|nr:glycosyltransferase [Bacteroidota bacterium]
MKKKLTILISTLNWGLGHSCRTTPIIKAFLKENCNVILAGYGNAGEFLKKEFPDLEYIHFPGIDISYPAKGNMALKMLLSTYYIFKTIRKEHKELEKIISEKKIDLVFSDNRYGLWSKKIPSIFLTHQLFIQTPQRLKFLKPLINKINHYYIKRFTECWIPDFEEEENLSGDLSHSKKISFPHHYIGSLTRFKKSDTTKNNSVFVIISGPEPQRTIFEEKIFDNISSINVNIIIAKGKADESYSNINTKNTTVISHPGTTEMEKLLNSSSLIISRPGYSTLMDLAILEKTAVFVATPGQTEQEYLAKRHNGKQFISIKQSDFSLLDAIKKGKLLVGSSKYQHNNFKLEKNIKRIVRG